MVNHFIAGDLICKTYRELNGKGELEWKSASFPSAGSLAEKAPCVIVGRCANFILKGRPNLFSVFLHADRATRMQRVTENYGVKPGGAAKAMDLMDSRRRTHCLHYTGQELGNARLYDLCVNTSDYGLERTVELILEAINTRTEQSPASETAPVREPALPEPEAEDIQGEISLA